MNAIHAYTLYVARGERNSEKAIQLLDMLPNIHAQVNVVDVRKNQKLPPWLKGVPTLYNARVGAPAQGTRALEQLIDEDDAMSTTNASMPYRNATAPKGRETMLPLPKKPSLGGYGSIDDVPFGASDRGLHDSGFGGMHEPSPPVENVAQPSLSASSMSSFSTVSGSGMEMADSSSKEYAALRDAVMKEALQERDRTGAARF